MMMIIVLLHVASTENEYPILTGREQLAIAASLDAEFSQNSASGDSGTYMPPIIRVSLASSPGRSGPCC